MSKSKRAVISLFLMLTTAYSRSAQEAIQEQLQYHLAQW
jgi:hypothetical protein